MSFNIKVETPNGIGYAYGQMPNGDICVAHGWSDLNKSYKNGHPKRRTVMIDYPQEEVTDVSKRRT